MGKSRLPFLLEKKKKKKKAQAALFHIQTMKTNFFLPLLSTLQYGLKAAFSEIERLHHEVTSAGNPIMMSLKTRYVVKGIQKETTINSVVSIATDSAGTITKVEDRWDGSLPDSSIANVSTVWQLASPFWWANYTFAWAWWTASWAWWSTPWLVRTAMAVVTTPFFPLRGECCCADLLFFLRTGFPSTQRSQRPKNGRRSEERRGGRKDGKPMRLTKSSSMDLSCMRKRLRHLSPTINLYLPRISSRCS